MSKFFLFVFFCISGELYAKVGFSSPFAKKVSFTIKVGKVFFKNSSSLPETIISNQLKYLFGILNEIDSGIDFPNLKIQVKDLEVLNDMPEISYQVKGEIAWDSKREIPRTFNFLLPKRGDEAGLTEFLNKYQKNCAKKPSSLATFWNYFRLHHEGCNLNGSSSDVVELSAHLSEKLIARERYEPNYRQIYDDNVLEITSILTKDNPLDVYDVSISDFKNLCLYFAKDSTFINQTANECHIEGFKNGQKVKANIFLIDNFNDKPEEFLQKRSPFFSKSDLVTFNGHSGMGVNIDSWIKYYPIPKGKYQVIFLNSCDTYGYFRNEFFNRYKILNQSRSSSEYVDVILNATPNFFGTFANTNRYLVDLLLKNESFDELLKGLPFEEHSVLLYEH